MTVATPPLPQRDHLTETQRLALQQALEHAITGEVRFDAVSRAMYATDASVYQLMPLGVVIPRSRDDVRRTLQICTEHGVSLTARGGGTSQAGQAIGRGIQLDFSKYLNRVLDVDTEALTVRVEPGIVLDHLNAHLRAYGLHLPVDISTSDRAVIGGMIANNSAGTRSVLYGIMIDYVEQLTVMLSDGSIVQMGALSEAELAAKMRQNDLEGACYRVVCQLAEEHAEEIDRRYPKIMRRVGGYNLNTFVKNGAPRNMAHMLVGSEGTLGLTLEATLRVLPLPKARAMCVVQFETILDAMAATPHILEHQPSAVELIDKRILDTTVGKTKYEPLRDFIVGNPGAILLVEVTGDAADALPERLEQIITTLRHQGYAQQVHRALAPGAQARIWSLRRAALGLTLAQTGDAKAISFVEDAAVDPRYLHDYIKEFQDILRAHDTEAGFYAHASVGLLHIRPVVNMKTATGIRNFASIAEQISDLVLRYGGAMSGEHGDGLVRSPFQEKMFGPVLYQAFCTIKRTFDPQGILNPGKIVHAPPLTTNLKFGTQYVTNPVQTVFDFSDFGGLSRAAEQCGNIGDCRKTLAGVMCPSYRATRDETDTTRGRANALRMAISGQLGTQGFTDKALYPVLELCVECKACKTECPTGVDMARMKSEYLHQYQQRYGTSWRSRLLAHAEQLAVWGSRLAPVSNWLVQHPATRWLNEKLLRLDRRRMPPRYARQTFLHWWATQHGAQQPGAPEIALFADTFSNFHEPQHAIAAAQLARRLGASITVPPRVCCGRPLISKGFLDEAARQAAAVTQTLLPLAERGIPIVFCEPSCYSAVRDDHPHLLRGQMQQQAQTVAKACLTFEEWAEAALRTRASHEAAPLFRAGPSKVVLHGHCHQKSLVGLEPATRLLSHIPQCEVVALDTSCCGMAGSFGYEQEHYEVSRACGEDKLFPAVRAINADTVTVAPGFSCRHQIAHFTGIEPETPMTLLERLSRPS
jgi:FAD/FMN-containing dehydrogenase/Fe-S oxidoreductase